MQKPCKCREFCATSTVFLQEQTGDFSFIIFLFLMVFFALYVYMKVPETKQKTIEEIVDDYSPGGELDVEEIDDDVMSPAKDDRDHSDRDSGHVPDLELDCEQVHNTSAL